MNRVIYFFILFSFLLSGNQVKSQIKKEIVRNMEGSTISSTKSDGSLAELLAYRYDIELLNRTYLRSDDIPEAMSGEAEDNNSVKGKSANIKVNPSSGNILGGCESQDYSVEISGATFGNGWDISNVTICGVEVCQIIMQSSNSVVVYPNAATPGCGDIVITSKSKGKTTIENGFTYLAPASKNQAKNLQYSNVGATSIDINWSRGSAESCVVFMNETKSEFVFPSNHTTYAASSRYGDGNQISNSGWYCVSNGSNASVSVSGLTPGKEYVVRVVEYNGLAGSENYLISNSSDNLKIQIADHSAFSNDSISFNTNSSIILGNAGSNQNGKLSGE